MVSVDRLNITLDDEHAEKLARLAERTHVQPGTVARSLLSSALDEVDADARNVVELLDGIGGAYERAQLGRTTGRSARHRRPRRPVDAAVASVELARAAVEDLDVLIRTHSLPDDTRARVARSLRSLERFPRMGAALGGRWEGFRFVLGPWRWLLLVYVYVEAEDRVVVVTIQDGRSSSGAGAVRL